MKFFFITIICSLFLNVSAKESIINNYVKKLNTTYTKTVPSKTSVSKKKKHRKKSKIENKKNTRTHTEPETKEINNYVVSINEIKNAPCKSTKDDATNLDLIKNYITNISDNDTTRITAVEHGVEFVNESPTLIAAFGKLVTSLDIIGNIKKEQIDFQQQFSINPSCKEVLCAVEKIWNGNIGIKILFINLKYGYNASEFSYDKSDRFTNEELSDVLAALNDLPNIFIPLGRENNQRLTHYTRDIRDSTVAGDARITLYDEWSRENSFERQYGVFHEMSHNIAYKLDQADLTAEWLSLSGWEQKGFNNWESSTGACFVSRYAQVNPMEDFAETVSGYRYNPILLQKICPSKYQYLKNNIFLGLEFTDPTNCNRFKERPTWE